MCQTETVTIASAFHVECKACVMIAAKSRGRRPKHTEGCGHVITFMEQAPKLTKKLQAELIKAVKMIKKHREDMKKMLKELKSKTKVKAEGKRTKVVKKFKVVGLNRVLQKDIVRAVKDMKRVRKINTQMKKKVHKELKNRMKEMKKQNKKAKVVKVVEKVDMGCQTDFEFIHKCMRSRCNEVQVCQ